MKKVIVAASMLLAAPAAAGDHGNDYGPPRRIVGYSKMCNVLTGHCDWEPRFARTGVPVYTHSHRPPIGYYPTPPVRYHHVAMPPQQYQPPMRADLLSQGPRCIDIRVSAIGIEAYDKEKAKEQATAALAEIVRARFGGRFMDISNAEAVVFECWKSATGNRASEKAADFGGRELHQCQVESRPCRAARTVADADDPATQAAIDRLERQGYNVTVQEPIPETKKPRLIRRLFKRDHP